MARVIKEQKNRWGAAKTQGGLDPQRADLWVVDFTTAVNGLNDQYEGNFSEQIEGVPSYFAQSVTLPEHRVRTETVNRDSRPYHMPSWDDPFDAVRMTFLLENRTDARSSAVYQMLNTWRLFVRAGRGSLGKERSVRLNSNYRINFRFPIKLMLLRGALVPLSGVPANVPAPPPPPVSTTFSTGQAAGNPTAQQGDGASFLERVRQRLARERTSPPVFSTAQTAATPFILNNDLQISGVYVLQKCWLGAFKMDALSYTRNELLTLEATFYVENILDDQVA